MRNEHTFSNIEISDDTVLISINPRVYPMDVIYSAAYIMLDKAYVILDGDPKEEIIVEMKPKREEKPEELANLFNEELLNYAVYKSQIEKNNGIRHMFIQRALLTNGFDIKDKKEEFIGDPEGIAVPWEEKYGKKNVHKKIC